MISHRNLRTMKRDKQYLYPRSNDNNGKRLHITLKYFVKADVIFFQFGIYHVASPYVGTMQIHMPKI